MDLTTGEMRTPSRRDLFSGSRSGIKSFQRVDAIAQAMGGVLWSALELPSGGLMVAGDDGTVFHFDGEAWSREALGTDLPIHALCQVPGGPVIGVGWMGVICEREDGEWRYVQGGHRISGEMTRESSRENLPLFGVTATESGDVWAVGDQGRIARYSEGVWHDVDAGTTANLRAVISTPDGAILIGGAGGALLKFQDGIWTSIATGLNCHITGLALLMSGEILGVGGEYSSDLSGFLGRILVIDHRGEGCCRELLTSRTLPRLRKVVPLNSAAVLVGDGGCAFTLDSFDDGAEPQMLETGLRHDLHDVAVFASGSLAFCGDGGTVLLESKEVVSRLAALSPVAGNDVSQWKAVAEGLSDKTLRSVWAASDRDVFVVGDNGTVLQYDGDRWSKTELTPAVRLHAVWGTSKDNVYAVGDRGMIFQYNGGIWIKVYQAPFDLALVALVGFGPHDIIAVGDEGFAVHFDGAEWTRMQTGTTSELYSVWGTDSEHVLAVGGMGTIVRWNGTRWDTFSAGTDNDLFGVWGQSLEDIHLVGLSGTIIRFHDNQWQKDFSGLRADLNAIAGRPDGMMIAVGTLGEVIVCSDGKWVPQDSGTRAGLRSITMSDGAAFAVGDGGAVIARAL